MPDEKLMTLDESARRINQAKAENLMSWQRTTLPFVQWGIGLLAIIVFGSIIFAGTVILPNIVKGIGPRSGICCNGQSGAGRVKFEKRSRESVDHGVSVRATARPGECSPPYKRVAPLQWVHDRSGALFCWCAVHHGQVRRQRIQYRDHRRTRVSRLRWRAPHLVYSHFFVGGALVSVGILAHYKVEVEDPFILDVSGVQYPSKPVVDKEDLSEKGARIVDSLCEFDSENASCF